MPEGGRGPSRPLILVVLAAAVTGLPSLLPGFIHDDHRIIEQNDLIRDAARLPSLLTRGYWTVDDSHIPNLYRPLTILSFAGNHAIGGQRPFGYRLVNLALHGLVAGLLFALGRRLFGPAPPRTAVDPALFAALLFAVHPVHTEVLGLVVGRGDLLAACGVLLAVLLFLRGRDLSEAGRNARARWPYGFSLLAFAAGFLSKESAVAAPFIVLAADLNRRRVARSHPVRPAWGYHAASAAVLLFLIGIRTAVLGEMGASRFTHFIDNPIVYQPFPLGHLTALKALARYAVLLFWPVRLSIDHSYNALPPAASPADANVILGGLILLAGAAGVAATWKRQPPAAFSLLFAALAMAPVSNLVVPIGTIMAERLLYLPSAGYCLLVGALLEQCQPRTSRGSSFFRAALAALLGLLAVRSAVRLFDWRDDRTIFAAAVTVTPLSARAQFNYGSASEDAGDAVAAEGAYRAAVAIWPGFSDAQYNLAGLLSRRKDWEEAILHYRMAVREQPSNVTYLVNLGHALNGAGRSAEALDPLTQAVDIDPKSDRGWTNLGAALLALDRPQEAVKAYLEAARVDPGNAEYHVNLALALEAAGDFAAAAEEYAKAAGGRPGDAILRYRLGRALEQAGRIAEAAGAYREAIHLAPRSPVPYRSLGLLLFRSGDPEGARESLERAGALDLGGEVMDEEARTILQRLRRDRPDAPQGSPPAAPERS